MNWKELNLDATSTLCKQFNYSWQRKVFDERIIHTHYLVIFVKNSQPDENNSTEYNNLRAQILIQITNK